MGEWEQFLISVQDIIDIWIKVQGVWLYLEPIFSSDDIMKQMPVEGARFKNVDKNWRDMMDVAQADPAALAVFKIPNLLERFQECHEDLERVQKGLNDYLETKRLYFPRFFFLSNDNLLEILSGIAVGLFNSSCSHYRITGKMPRARLTCARPPRFVY